MCGIVGILDQTGLVSEATLAAMADRISYRGPDSSGVWRDPEEGVGFAHRRLSIVDLSPAGHQPMQSSTGRYTITFNGEVFNFKELAQSIKTPLRGGSDTEVMLACFEAYGVKASVERFVGMFAFAVFDRQERTVTLVRDRLGIKPLYYGYSAGAFVFASDLHAFRALPGWGAQISRDALTLFMRYGFVPAPWSIYEGIFKLPPGTLLEYSLDSLATRKLPTPQTYWSMIEISRRSELIEDPEEVLRRTEALLQDAIRLRMIADVPLGAFLSGGIDSSLVVALMQSQASTHIRTFAIGFGEEQYNEAPFARAVAEHLHTDHRELRVTPQDAQMVIPNLQDISDEPFGDASIIPTYLVSKLAREHVTVSLSGDGGDELFGGYDRYLLLDRVFNAKRFLPRPINSALLKAAHLLPLAQADKLQTLLQKSGLFPFKLNQPGEKIRRVLSLLDSASAEELYYRSIQHWPDDAGVVVGGNLRIDVPHVPMRRDARSFMALADIVMYLPDDILTKVDRASMACSLEARVPFLDHRLVEFAAQIPSQILYRDGRGKWPLRQILSKFIPQELIDRPKRGFSIPLDDWLRSSLREWASELLSEQALGESGAINPSPVVRAWADHLSGKRNLSQLLWNVLMFQAWNRAQLG